MTVSLKYNWNAWADKIGLLTVLLVLISNLILPESLGITRLENIILPLLCIVLIGKNSFQSNKGIIYCLIGLFITSVFSNLVNLKGLEAYINSIRFLKYIFLFLITGHLIKEEKIVFHKMIDFIVLILIAISLLQIFNPFEWGTEIQKIYSNQSQTYELNKVFNRNFRLYGTQNNPNNFAVFWGMFAIYYFVRNLEIKQVKNYIFLAFSIIFLFLTQSRTSLVGLIFSFGVYYFFKNLSFKTFFILLASFGLFIIVINLSGMSYIQQIIYNNPLKIHSFQLRLDIWKDVLEVWKTHPVFGVGLETSFENLIGKAPDNELLFILASGGIFMAFFYLALFIIIGYIGFKHINDKNPYYGLYILLPLFLLINSITNYSLNNVKITTLFFILLALVNVSPKISKQ